MKVLKKTWKTGFSQEKCSQQICSDGFLTGKFGHLQEHLAIPTALRHCVQQKHSTAPAPMLGRCPKELNSSDNGGMRWWKWWQQGEECTVLRFLRALSETAPFSIAQQSVVVFWARKDADLASGHVQVKFLIWIFYLKGIPTPLPTIGGWVPSSRASTFPCSNLSVRDGEWGATQKSLYIQSEGLVTSTSCKSHSSPAGSHRHHA